MIGDLLHRLLESDDFYITTAAGQADVIVAMRIVDAGLFVQGSEAAACAACGAAVWLAPQTLRAFRGLPLPAIRCLHCAVTHLEEAGPS